MTRALGVEMEEIHDWSCCGASSAHVRSPARRRAPRPEPRACRRAGLRAIGRALRGLLQPPRLARHALWATSRARRRMPEIVERPIAARARCSAARAAATSRPRSRAYPAPVRAAPRVLLRLPAGPSSRADRVRRPRAAVEHGRLIGTCGASTVRWNMAVECCGGSFSVCRTGSVIRLGRAILDDARRAGAQAILVACPMCQSNLDFRQAAMRLPGRRCPCCSSPSSWASPSA